MKPLKAVIIGSGLIAQLKHIPAFHKHRDKVHLAAICDVNLEAARKAAAAAGVPSAYADVGEMLAKGKAGLSRHMHATKDARANCHPSDPGWQSCAH